MAVRLRLARAAAALVVAVAVSPVSAPPVAAAGVTFGRASATANFGDRIELRQQVTLPGGVHRIDALVATNDSDAILVAPVASPGAGAQALTYDFATPFGRLYPNTVVTLGFRVTLDDGSQVEGPTATVRYEDDRFAWQTLDGRFVRVHWVTGDRAFGQRAAAIGDAAVDKASKLLGVDEKGLIDFFIYADRNAFFEALGPGTPETAGGLAAKGLRTLFANIAADQLNASWVSLVVPHELTHAVFETAVDNPYHFPLHWLNEGLADYLAIGYDANARASVQAAVRSGDLMPLHALAGQFPSPAQRFSLAYDESVSAIDYLIRTYGQDALVKLIRSYASGVSDDAAFTTGLGVDTAAFEAGWLRDLGAKQPLPFGPKDAPSGPLPPGWSGTGGAAGTATPGGGGNGSDSGTGGGGTPAGWSGLATGSAVLAGVLLVVLVLLLLRRLGRAAAGASGPSLSPSGGFEPPEEPPSGAPQEPSTDVDVPPRSPTSTDDPEPRQ